MARKKKESGSRGGEIAPWMATFADLMNLLLCFFVLLFAFSSVDEEKFEDISVSMANSFGVFDGGEKSVGTAQLISAGISQLNDLDVLFESMGKTVEGQSDTKDIKNTEDGVEGESGSEGVMNDSEGAEGIDGSKGTQGIQGAQNTSNSENSSNSDNVSINEALDKIEAEMKKVTTDMYDQVSDLSDQYNLGDFVELSIDPEYHFIQLTLKGAILYDSGSAEIKSGAEPVLTRIGKILKTFEKYTIEVTGHTDNVPITNASFQDNNWLSSARALNAAEFLIKNCAIDPKHMKYSGRGEYEPIVSNATAEGRAKNRRIEIKIYNEYSGN